MIMAIEMRKARGKSSNCKCIFARGTGKSSFTPNNFLKERNYMARFLFLFSSFFFFNFPSSSSSSLDCSYFFHCLKDGVGRTGWKKNDLIKREVRRNDMMRKKVFG